MSAFSAIQQLASQLFNRLPVNSPPDPVEEYQLSFNPFETYISNAKKLGLNGQYIFLSFDCDTDLDAELAEGVHDYLEYLGIKATYAVPGAQLLRAPEPYKRLSERGAEFMNHGGLPHTEWQEDRWVGRTFYNTMTNDDVENDIRNGHKIVSEVIGKKPLGFRAPHFGCYQEPEQVNRMHSVAASLGYTYCSTTLPSFGLENGPAYKSQGVMEVPCFGSVRNPGTTLDSWTYLIDKKNYALGHQYFELMAETLNMFVEQQIPVVFTWYADPSHVVDQEPFYRAMEMVSSLGVKSVSGSELVSIVEANDS